MYYFRSITLRPKNKQEWFNLWLILVIIIISICFFIIIIDRPMNETDFIQYMYPISPNISNNSLSDSSLLRSDNLMSISNNSNINIIDSYNQLSQDKLLNIPQQYIPNITDYTEDDLW
jgi:ABC-type microcin C transport system permease subunit YejE